MSLYAIADLHLSSSGEKPMDIFGAHWAGHADKIRARWMEVVSPEDTVLIPGDISWAMRFEEAIPDLEWIAALPGTKVMVRGNHDYWWSSKRPAARLQAMIPPSLVPLHKTAHVVEQDGRRIGVAGTRGWVVPPATPHDAEIIATEIQRLRASLDSLPPVDALVGMIHFPPFTPELGDTEFARLFREAGARTVVYGHVHRGKGRFFDGERDGVRYRNVAADQVDFQPQPLF
ncbi:MAG: metallophosphoesterase [Armatimonadetes bacterium]|nr:metallophosphoesterase [Armatimonadota bacterium]